MTQPGEVPADEWRPAGEAEQRMLLALEREDTAEFFRIVLANPLYVPIRAVGAAGQPVTWELPEVHLLAFTTLAGVRAGLGDGFATVLKVSYDELLRSWPDPRWRLLLNPTLPIDAALAIEDVGRAARTETAVQVMAAPPAPAPGAEPPWAGADVNGLPPEPALADFVPADETEAELADALSTQDVSGTLDVLLTAAVLLPTRYPITDTDGIRDPGFPWVVLGGDDAVPPYIPVFTSPSRLVDAAIDSAQPTVTVDLIEVLLAWPYGDCKLVVNPDSAIEFTADGGQVPALIGWAANMLKRFDDEADDDREGQAR